MEKLSKIFLIGGITVIFLIIIFYPFSQNKKASSDSIISQEFIKPFGGKIEKYNPSSKACCVKEIVGKLNNVVQNTIREAVNSALAPVYATLAAAGPPFSTVVAAALAVAVNTAIEAIKIANVEEIVVGKPLPTKAAILDFGNMSFDIKIKLFGKKVKIASLSFSLFNLMGLVPEGGIYDYKEYKKENIWVIGTTFNFLNICKKEEEKDQKENSSGFIKNKVLKVICDAIKNYLEEKEGEQGNNQTSNETVSEETTESESSEEKCDSSYCPLTTILYQIGTGKIPEPSLQEMTGSLGK